MRFTDVNIFGVIIAPFVPMMLVAGLVVFVLRRLMLRTRSMPWLWHPALFDFSLYVIVLCLVVLATGAWNARV